MQYTYVRHKELCLLAGNLLSNFFSMASPQFEILHTGPGLVRFLYSERESFVVGLIKSISLCVCVFENTFYDLSSSKRRDQL